MTEIQVLSMISLYRDDKEVRKDIRKYVALAHMPPESIDEAWINGWKLWRCGFKM